MDQFHSSELRRESAPETEMKCQSAGELYIGFLTVTSVLIYEDTTSN